MQHWSVISFITTCWSGLYYDYVCCVISFYNIYYPGDFIMWRSTAPGVTAVVNLSVLVLCSHKLTPRLDMDQSTIVG